MRALQPLAVFIAAYCALFSQLVRASPAVYDCLNTTDRYEPYRHTLLSDCQAALDKLPDETEQSSSGCSTVKGLEQGYAQHGNCYIAVHDNDYAYLCYNSMSGLKQLAKQIIGACSVEGDNLVGGVMVLDGLSSETLALRGEAMAPRFSGEVQVGYFPPQDGWRRRVAHHG